MKLKSRIQNKAIPEMTGTIITTPKPPHRWCVEFDNGRRKLMSKSFIKKYYQLLENDND